MNVSLLDRDALGLMFMGIFAGVALIAAAGYEALGGNVDAARGLLETTLYVMGGILVYVLGSACIRGWVEYRSDDADSLGEVSGE